MCKIEVDITYIVQDESKKFSPVDRVNRIVRIDGREVYNETTDWDIYYAFNNHPIRQFELFLLGFEKTNNASNACSKRSQTVGFLKKIWLKFFRKKINFRT